jgi:hypothetical protein
MDKVQESAIVRFQLVGSVNTLAGSYQNLDDGSYLGRDFGLSSMVKHPSHRDAIDKVHDHIDSVFLLNEVKDSKYVRVVDASGNSRFIDQHLDDTRVRFQQPFVDQFQRDVVLEAVRPLLDGMVDGRHAPPADLTENAIAA